MTGSKLDEAIRVHDAAQPPAPFVQARGESGELAVALSPDGGTRRVVLVTGADSRGIGQILLASNAVEQATDLDLVVGVEESGAPYELTVQAELYGPVFLEQLDRLVGKCALDVTEAIRSALRTDGESLAGRAVGMPLGGSDDPRRRFKEDELYELQEIVSQCRRWLAGDLSEVVSIHPEELFPPPVGTPLDEGFGYLERVRDLLSGFERTGRRLPFELLALMDDHAAAEIRRWRTEYGFDMWGRLQRLYEDAQTALIEEERVGAGELTGAFLAIHAKSGTSTVDLITTTSVSSEVQIIRSESSRPNHFCRARLRIVEEVA